MKHKFNILNPMFRNCIKNYSIIKRVTRINPKKGKKNCISTQV